MRFHFSTLTYAVVLTLSLGTLLQPGFCRGQENNATGRQRGMLLTLAFSRDNALLVTGGDSVRVYDVESADIVEKWESPPLIRAVSFSPTEARVLAEAGDNGAIRFRRISEKEPFRVIQAHAGRVAKLAFSPGGKLGISTATVLGEGAPVRAAYSLDGEHLITATSSGRKDALGRSAGHIGQIEMRETKSGKPIWSTTTDDDRREIAAIAVSPDGKRVACCTHATILIVDSRTGKVLHAIGGAE